MDVKNLKTKVEEELMMEGGGYEGADDYTLDDDDKTASNDVS